MTYNIGKYKGGNTTVVTSNRVKEIAEGILNHVGGESNIVSFDSCMTRVRLILKDKSKVDKTKLEKMRGIIGIVQSGRQTQIIVGPGVANNIVEYMKQDTSIYKRDIPEFKDRDKVRARVKEKYNEPLSNIFKRITGRFRPHKG